MDEKSINLIIEINYENAKFKIEREEEISYNELKEESIKFFNIELKNGDNIEFIYTDEDNEKNILEHNNEDIFSSANYIDDNYRLNLDIIIVSNQKSNVENKIYENKKELSIINIYNESKNINQVKREENKEIERSKNEIDNKLIHLGLLLKKQFNTIKKDISEMINLKYKEIENELTKLNIQVNNINNTNNNVNIPRSVNKSKRNGRQANNFQIFSEKKKIKENNDEINFERCSTFSHFKKDISGFEMIHNNNYDINNISDHSDEDDEEDNNIDKDAGNHGNIITNKDKKREKIMDKIRKNINKLYRKQNYAYNDIVTKGNNIFEFMNGKNTTIEVNELNKHIKKYLTEGHKQKILPKEKIKYCNILKYLNHFLEIKKVQTKLDDKLKKEIENQITEENNKEKTKQNEAEKRSEDKLTSLFNSINRNNNKIYVQEKLKELLAETSFEFNKSKIENSII